MSADPWGPGLSLIILFLLGAFVRATDAALPLIDESELRKNDTPRAARVLKLAALAEDRFGSLFMTHAFLMLAACACAELWLCAPLAAALGGAFTSLSAGGCLSLLVLLL